jgi:hypothetical protein
MPNSVEHPRTWQTLLLSFVEPGTEQRLQAFIAIMAFPWLRIECDVSNLRKRTDASSK